MIPRGRLDAGWRDLAAGCWGCRGGGADDARHFIEETWAAPGFGLACLSLRSGLDATLEAMELPPGSKVLVSAVTLPDMIRVVRHHGLVPVPVPVDASTLAVRPSDLERLADADTRAVLVAHLFGSRMPLDAVIATADRLGLPVLEDCAQAYVGDGWRGHQGSVMAGFSFGPIKTATALGGGVLVFRDAELRRRVGEVMAAWPWKTRAEFRGRITKMAAVKLLTTRPGTTLLDRICRMTGRDRDEWLRAALRGFRGELIPALRWRPSPDLLCLMARRLRQSHAPRIASRADYGRALAAHLEGVSWPGSAASQHAHWVFPVLSRDPAGLAETLRLAGFDATCYASNIRDIGAPDGGWSSRMVYLPMWPGLPESRIAQLAGLIRSFEQASV